jgi:hypothetical protein
MNLLESILHFFHKLDSVFNNQLQSPTLSTGHVKCGGSDDPASLPNDNSVFFTPVSSLHKPRSRRTLVAALSDYTDKSMGWICCDIFLIILVGAGSTTGLRSERSSAARCVGWIYRMLVTT